MDGAPLLMKPNRHRKFRSKRRACGLCKPHKQRGAHMFKLGFRVTAQETFNTLDELMEWTNRNLLCEEHSQ